MVVRATVTTSCSSRALAISVCAVLCQRITVICGLPKHRCYIPEWIESRKHVWTDNQNWVGWKTLADLEVLSLDHLFRSKNTKDLQSLKRKTLNDPLFKFFLNSSRWQCLGTGQDFADLRVGWMDSKGAKFCLFDKWNELIWNNYHSRAIISITKERIYHLWNWHCFVINLVLVCFKFVGGKSLTLWNSWASVI